MSTISQLNGQAALRAAAAAQRATAPSLAAKSATVARQPDGVTISETARAMLSATRTVADAPDVREDRVSALKSALAAGTYSVDSRALAGKLIDVLK